MSTQARPPTPGSSPAAYQDYTDSNRESGSKVSEEIDFSGWAIVELMGRRRLGGYVATVSLAGAQMLRIDVPESDNQAAATQFYGASALYCITPTTEEIARAVATMDRPTPVSEWELRRAQKEAPLLIETTDDNDDEYAWHDPRS